VENKKESNISREEYLELFEKAMKKLALAIDKVMGEERYFIYFEQLHKYPIEEIQAAVDQAIHDEEFSVIPPVGKLIRYIEDAREERRLRFRPVMIEYQEQWPEVSQVVREKYIKPLMEKLGMNEGKTPEEKETRWKERKEELRKQVSLVKRTAEPVEPR
jgi:hypothetical protein